MKRILTDALIAVPLVALVIDVAWASGDAHGSHDGVPTVVYWQVFNFVLFAMLLFFLGRKKVAGFFSEKETGFRQALLKAEKAKEAADIQKRETQERLMKLQANADTSVTQARAEAEALRKKIVDEATQMSLNLKEEAHRTAQFELERAKAELRAELVDQAMKTAKAILEEKMAEPDQKRLQSEFVEKIQVVR